MSALCVSACVCVLSYLLHSEYQNTYPTSKVRAFLESGGILAVSSFRLCYKVGLELG